MAPITIGPLGQPSQSLTPNTLYTLRGSQRLSFLCKDMSLVWPFLINPALSEERRPLAEKKALVPV